MIQRIQGILNSIQLTQNAKKTAKALLKKEFPGAYVPSDLAFLSKKDKEKIVADADRLLGGAYQIYNFPAYEAVNWHRDPVSGICVKPAPCTALIGVSALQNRADVKNYWEQSHLHPLLTLAQGYALTGRDVYAQRAAALATDFIEKNPCGKTIAWKCHMDSAIRLANLVEAMAHIRESNAFLSIEKKVQRSVAEHVCYIAADYENKGKFPNNHYLSDLTGVMFGVVYLYKNYDNREVLPYFEDAKERLCHEIKRQIHQDGFDYEHSTYYHCFVTELLAELQAMLQRNGMEMPEGLLDVTEKMMSVCHALGVFEGKLPLIGDQDGSRLFHEKGCFDMERCDFSTLKRFLGQDAKGSTQSAGIYILENEDAKVFFKCGAIGTGGNGTHDHNDQLSVTVFLGGEMVIADSGTYCYTADAKKRTAFRSVKAHSTVHFEDKEQNDITNIFSVKTNLSGKLLAKEKSALMGEFVYADGETHKRKISLKDHAVLIEDEAKNGISRLVLPVEMEKIQRKNDFEIAFSINGVFAHLRATEAICLQKATISPAYGVEIPATYIDSKVQEKQTYILEREIAP